MVQFILLTPQLDFASVEVNAIGSNLELKPTVVAPIVDIDEPLIISYEEIIKDNCTFRTECDGVTVDLLENVEYLSFEVNEVDDVEFGTLTVIVTDISGTTSENTTYMYNNGIELYYNEFAMEQAWFDGTQSLYEQNTEDNIVLSYRDWEEEYSELMSSILSGESQMISTNNEKTVVSGIIEWELSSYSKLPLRNAYVELIVKTDFEPIILSSTYTDENGHYCLETNNSDWDYYNDIYVRINLEGHTFKVRSGWWTFPYYFDKKLSDNYSAGVNLSFDATITRDVSKKIYKATYVHQSMVIGERFAEEMGFETNNKIRVAYPAGKEDISDPNDPLAHLSNAAFCWGNIENNCFCAIGWYKFYYVNTMVHEYSHYVQCSLSNFGGKFPEILFNSIHSARDDEYSVKKDKEFAMHLAWTEGWGRAFAYVALKYYQNQYSAMPYYDIKPIIMDGTNSEDIFLGEFQEMTVTAFLWELLDISKTSYTANNSDALLDYQIPWTPQEWWNMTTVSGTCRFPDFMHLLDQEAYDDSMNIDYKSVKSSIAEKLTKYNIAPEINTISFVASNP